MTNDGLVALQPGRAESRARSWCPISPSRFPTPTDGGQDVHLPAAPGHPLLERPRWSRRPTSARRSSATSSSAPPVSYYDGIVGARALQDEAEALRPLARASSPTTRRGRSPSTSSRPTRTSCTSSRFRSPTPSPPGTPLHDVGTHPLPATGPYRIAAYRPEARCSGSSGTRTSASGRRRRSRTGYPDGIVVRFGGTADAGDRRRRSAARRTSLRRSIATRSPGPADGARDRSTRASVHTESDADHDRRSFSTRGWPRSTASTCGRALNYAVDRSAGVAGCRRPGRGPARPARSCPRTSRATGATAPTPPAVEPGRHWTAPDLAKARALVARSGTRGMKSHRLVVDAP